MYWSTEIDLYCERLSPLFWAEPINTLSNSVFVVAAVWGWYTATRKSKLDRSIKLLCILSAGISVGSFLFHTYANLWSSFADVIPIWSFIALYVTISVIKLTGKSPLRVGGIAAGVIAVVIGIIWIMSSGSATQTKESTDLFNGSTQYTPALVALWFFSLVTIQKKLVIRPWILGAALVFTVSLVVRTMDLYLCELFPIGTHFLWHILNGLMIALLLQGLIRMNWRS